MRIFWFILKTNLWRGTLQEYRQMKKNIPIIITTYKTIQEKLSDKTLIGNPTFLEGVSYEQDLAIVIRPFFKTASFDDAKKIIDGYRDSIFELWKWGIYEKTFNFTINNGINHQGKVILIDFNEVVFTHQEATTWLLGNRWKTNWSRSKLPAQLRDYYDQVMGRAMTVENLDRYWEKHDTLDL